MLLAKDIAILEPFKFLLLDNIRLIPENGYTSVVAHPPGLVIFIDSCFVKAHLGSLLPHNPQLPRTPCTRIPTRRMHENCDPKIEIDDLKSQLEAERKARAKAEHEITELKETFEKRRRLYYEERDDLLETIKCLEETVESTKKNNDSALLDKIRILENELANMKAERSALSVESPEPAESDPPALEAECKPNSFKKSENSVILTLGLHMLLGGQRQMNLDGIMSLFTEFYSDEDFDGDDKDAWKKYFVKVAACEMNGKMENISSVAERLLNNKHTQLYQDPVKGVLVEKSKFDEGEIKSVVKTLGLHMMNLDGIMSLFTEFYSEEVIDDDDAWKKYFVKVTACEMNGKMENISSAAERLLNNKHTQLFQDPVKGVFVEKSKFDEGEIKCLELICDAMCINFTAS
uniref:FRIGIDA-like protein n=1 Tax=Panagrellus redivivus TaxID=6233 RepID=A0A7E4V2H0_PANRE